LFPFAQAASRARIVVCSVFALGVTCTPTFGCGYGVGVEVDEAIGVGVGVGPLILPVTSLVPPLVSAKRTVMVAFCCGSLTVIPVQVVVSALVTAPQCEPSTWRSVGMKMAGVLPMLVFDGPVLVNVKVPEPVLVQEPVTAPLAVHAPVMLPTQGTPACPLLGGLLTSIGTSAGFAVGVGVLVRVGPGVYVATGVGSGS
jgi:hypothetical protein